jgi:hypothetical protein
MHDLSYMTEMQLSVVSVFTHNGYRTQDRAKQRQSLWLMLQHLGKTVQTLDYVAPNAKRWYSKGSWKRQPDSVAQNTNYCGGKVLSLEKHLPDSPVRWSYSVPPYIAWGGRQFFILRTHFTVSWGWAEDYSLCIVFLSKHNPIWEVRETSPIALPWFVNTSSAIYDMRWYAWTDYPWTLYCAYRARSH